jgi:hypothetical protein
VPEILLPKIEKKERLTKLLSYISLFLALIIAVTVGVGMWLMFDKIAGLERAAQAQQNESLDDQFDVLDERLMLIAEFRKSELKKIVKFTKQLEKLSSDCSAEKAQPFINYLGQREDDFQTLLDVIKEGSSNLASMNKGSKTWLKSHSQSLQDLSTLSKERQAALDALQ